MDALVSEAVFHIAILHEKWPCGPDFDTGKYTAAWIVQKAPDGSWQHGNWELGPVVSERGDYWPPQLMVPDQWEIDLAEKYNAPLRDDYEADVDPVPFYSTDLLAAWLVVEHMLTQGYRFELVYEKTPPEADWGALFSAHDGAGYGLGETAPLAICRAALKASWGSDG